MDWLESKYIGIVSHRLGKFVRKGPNLYNFRCPKCGDSEKSQTKARAYIFEKQGKSAFHCHNCGATSSVSNLIKFLDINIYADMQLERLQGNKSPAQVDYEQFVDKMKKPAFLKSGPLKTLKKISQLSPDHPAKKFIEKRKIPNPYHAKLFHCPNFMHYVNTLIPNKFDEDALKNDESRIIIPFFDENKNLHALQGRSLGDSSAKYITIILDETKPKIYGLDTVDFKKPVYVFEGPIDSMFIGNGIAVAGGEMIAALKGYDKNNFVLVYDNEPRSRETRKKLDKAINNGYKVVIWPENLEHKDINDMILAGLSPEFIVHIMKSNTHKDLIASLELGRWSKV